MKFFQGIKTELEHITWPDRTTTLVYTGTVVAISLLVAYYLGLFDWLFSLGLQQII